MASQAPNNAPLPILYESLDALNSAQHGDSKLKRLEVIERAGKIHAVPLTIEEFGNAQRDFPIIFSAGDDSVPLALMGLNEGVNVFLDDKGMPRDRLTYVPAYLRRFPFLLARLRPDSDELSLCFDPTAGAVVEGKEGEPLFVDGQPSEVTRNILNFCEQFEAAGQRTQAFMKEIKDMGLLMDGEVSIQAEGQEQPFIYRGFRMIDEEKLRNLRGDELRKMNQSGLLGLIYAHLMSLGLIRDIFGMQNEQGKGPLAAPAKESKGAAKKADAEA